ncbi:hypothetical protein Q9299_01485 [Gemmobacter fulvus]|uniref:hypothetical protein n=1 Tax=Gemmobacter fulvus TaxID=2840474 RepID=UPI0027967318|nr:hypothetical protein [Gemmobacter fulvus]MDQ1846947.1 hypothetical protein [Gemmobacter fulvus]
MRFALFILALVAAGPATAGSFRPPAGCETFMTVQSRGCRVSNHYQCSADQKGDQWRADFDQEGMFFLSRIDREAQWVESFDLNPTVRQTLDPNPADAASFTDLLAGRDDFDFRLSKETGEKSHVTGHDALTGKSMTIDGVTLLQTAFDFTEVDAEGNELRRARGNEFVHPEWRLFFAGPSEWHDGNDWLPVNGSPVQFVFPGEPGFESTQPIFECGALMSRAPLHPPVQEASYAR